MRLIAIPQMFPNLTIKFVTHSYCWAFLVAQLVKNLPAIQETWVQSLGWEDPLEKEKATHSSILAWRTVHGVTRSRTQLSAFLFHFHFCIVSIIVSMIDRMAVFQTRFKGFKDPSFSFSCCSTIFNTRRYWFGYSLPQKNPRLPHPPSFDGLEQPLLYLLMVLQSDLGSAEHFCWPWQRSLIRLHSTGKLSGSWIELRHWDS